jgi:hypothetical protein
MSNLTEMDRYNTLVKPMYQVDKRGFDVVLNEFNYDKSDADIPYYEIPSNETLSGHAEIFELHDN